MKKLPLILAVAGLAIIVYAFTTEGVYRALLQIGGQIPIGGAILLMAPRFKNQIPKGIYYTFLIGVSLMLIMMGFLLIDMLIRY